MAIARVQFKTGSAAATSISVTMDSAPTNGNALAIAVTTLSGTDARVSSISQTGATWVKAVSVANASNPETEIWYALNVSSASASLTVNLAASLTAKCIVAEYSGISTSGALDKTASNTGTGPPASTGTTATTAFNVELWFAALASANTSGFYLNTPSNGFSQVASVGDSFLLLGLYEKIVSSTGAASTSDSWSLVSESELWAGAIATLADTSSGSGRRVFVIR